MQCVVHLSISPVDVCLARVNMVHATCQARPWEVSIPNQVQVVCTSFCHVVESGAFTLKSMQLILQLVNCMLLSYNLGSQKLSIIVVKRRVHRHWMRRHRPISSVDIDRPMCHVGLSSRLVHERHPSMMIVVNMIFQVPHLINEAFISAVIAFIVSFDVVHLC